LIRKEYVEGCEIARLVITGASSAASSGSAAGAAAGSSSAAAGAAGAASGSAAGTAASAKSAAPSRAADRQADFMARLTFAQVSLEEFDKALTHYKTRKIREGKQEFVNDDRDYCYWMGSMSRACELAGIKTDNLISTWNQYAALSVGELRSRTNIVDQIQACRARSDELWVLLEICG
jgi:hypothetical protein